MQEKKKTLLLPCLTNRLNMKIIRFIIVLSTFTACFYSCSSKVDLYADYKDVTIVYAMLNPRADTNYVKITRAFCGTNDNPINANDVALIADSSNYPGKLDARITEFKNTHDNSYAPTGRVIILDTITLHDKEEGIFYAPDQLFYYTTEPFNTGTSDERYKYRLVVVKPNGDSLTAKTSIVGNEEFAIMTNGVSFQHAPTEVTKDIYFRADGAAPLYEVSIQFNYREQLEGQEMKRKNVNRSFGTKTLSEYTYVVGNSYVQEYSMNWLFNALANAIGGDTIVNPNHPNVVRYIDNFVITISAGGEELNIYYLANQSQSESPTSLVTTYTNIEGGYGLFSSRTTIQKEVKLSSNTKRELFGISSWGFKEQ